MRTHLISIAPMMGYTDRHYRKLMRLLTQHTRLYTEMLTTGALLHGDRQRLLAYHPDEHPIALQLGGHDPVQLALCARIGEEQGYDEINLNVGCPSDRVKAGRFGACLMKEPAVVATAVQAMQQAVQIPVTVKMRIGVDDQDSYAALVHFVQVVASAGCQTFLIHARKAWLQGLSPEENRTIPPLQYETVYQLKRDFPKLTIVINGGIKSLEAIDEHLSHVDGVMIGREGYANPFLFAAVDQRYFPESRGRQERTLIAILTEYLPYAAEELAHGTKLRHLTRHLVRLFRHQPQARYWRRYLSEPAHLKEKSTRVLEEVLLEINDPLTPLGKPASKL